MWTRWTLGALWWFLSSLLQITTLITESYLHAIRIFPCPIKAHHAAISLEFGKVKTALCSAELYMSVLRGVPPTHYSGRKPFWWFMKLIYIFSMFRCFSSGDILAEKSGFSFLIWLKCEIKIDLYIWGSCFTILWNTGVSCSRMWSRS